MRVVSMFVLLAFINIFLNLRLRDVINYDFFKRDFPRYPLPLKICWFLYSYPFPLKKKITFDICKFTCISCLQKLIVCRNNRSAKTNQLKGQSCLGSAVVANSQDFERFLLFKYCFPLLIIPKNFCFSFAVYFINLAGIASSGLLSKNAFYLTSLLFMKRGRA